MVEQQSNKKSRSTDDIGDVRGKATSLHENPEDIMEIEMNEQSVRRSPRKQMRKKTRTTSKTLEDYNSDSASVDSQKAEFTTQQIMDHIEKALDGDRASLERLVDDTRVTVQSISDIVAIMDDNVVVDFHNLLLQSQQLPVYGQYRWLEEMISARRSVLNAAVSRESRKVLDPLIDRRQSITDQCHRLRGKLDLLMGAV